MLPLCAGGGVWFMNLQVQKITFDLWSPIFLDKTRHVSNVTSKVCEANSGILLSLKFGCRLTNNYSRNFEMITVGVNTLFCKLLLACGKLISASISKLWIYILKILSLVHFNLPRVMITFKEAAVKIQGEKFRCSAVGYKCPLYGFTVAFHYSSRVGKFPAPENCCLWLVLSTNTKFSRFIGKACNFLSFLKIPKLLCNGVFRVIWKMIRHTNLEAKKNY